MNKFPTTEPTPGDGSPLEWGMPVTQITQALDYLKRMGVDADAFGIINWIDRKLEADQEFDHKYARRLIDALITVKGGKP